jgi:predicted acyl esterase
MRRLAIIAGTAALLVGVAVPAAAQAADAENAYTWSEAYIPTADPTVELHADVLTPKGLPAGAKTPVIMVVSPYLNHAGMTILDYDPTRADGPQAYYTELNEIGRPWARGYTVVLVDLRGFGGSSGCNDFGGPGEQSDVKTAVEWAADQQWSTGKVGLFGKSYDGWTVIMGLATKPRGLAAAVPLAPIIDGYRTLYMNGLHYGPGWWATPAVYQAQDAMPGTVNDNAAYWQHIALGTNPACHASQIALQNGLQDKDDPLGFWAARDLVARARTSTVPTFWEHGFLDINAKPDNFLDVMSGQRGSEIRGWFGQWPHDRPNKELLGRDGFYLETMRFFDRHLKGDTTVPADPAFRIQDNVGRWRTEEQWPPADAAPFSMPIKAGTFTDTADNSAENGALLGTPGHGTWTFSQPMPYTVHLSGVPKVSVDVTTTGPRTNLVGLLYDLDAAGKATLITRGAFAVKQSGAVAFETFPQDWRLLPGHRIGVLISGSDESLWNPVHSQTTATVRGGTVTLPALARLRTFESTSVGKPSSAMKARPVPFTVSAATIAAGSEQVALPPQQQ